MVEVLLSSALICFQGSCHHALVGKETPRGEYVLLFKKTPLPGYGGDVIVYKEDAHLWAIHRTWTLKPQQRREERLKSDRVEDRFITAGCINVSPTVYLQLVECCLGQKLVIK